MTYENRTDFVKDFGIHKTNVVETMKSFEKDGLNDKQIKEIAQILNIKPVVKEKVVIKEKIVYKDRKTKLNNYDDY